MFARLALTGLAILQFTVHSWPLSSRSEPCAQISALLHQNTTEARSGRVPPDLALACLQSVPLEDKNATLSWLTPARAFLDWHTTTPYLKSPPDTYKLPGVDIFGGLDRIITSIESGDFNNQYELETNLTNLIVSAHDGHLSLTTTLVGYLFNFKRTLSLVSASDDGFSPPRPYVYSDVVLAMNEKSFKPSPIVSFDGMDVIDALPAESLQGNCQDPDALYNQLFHNLALSTLRPTGSNSNSAAGFIPSSTDTQLYKSNTVVFENGTSATFAIVAEALLLFDDITTGIDVYNKYLNPPSLNKEQPTPEPTTTSIPRPGYPMPVVSHPQNLVAGYYLNTTGADVDSSVAILSLPTFNPGTIDESRNYSKLMYDFLLRASSTDGGNKSRLIIDLTGNPGGQISLAYNLFLDLFPDVLPTLFNRLRAIPPINAMGELAERYLDPATEPFSIDSLAAFPFAYQQDQDINFRPFPSWSAKYGPVTRMGFNYTNLMQFNISDPFYQKVLGGQNYTPPTRPFPNPSNIVLLTDGICASTCSILVHLLRDIMGVRTVVAGGRPNGSQPMAAVGGTRGVNVYGFVDLHTFANMTYELLGKANISESEREAEKQLLRDNGVQNLFESYEKVVRRIPAGTVNSRDLIQTEHVEDGVPTHFLYQPADCRIWYTMQSATSAEALWKDVADVTWSGKPCVWGSMGN